MESFSNTESDLTIQQIRQSSAHLFTRYFYTQLLIHEFDQDLESPETAKSVLKSPSYRKLLALREMLQGSEEAILDNYRAAIDTAWKSGLSGASSKEMKTAAVGAYRVIIELITGRLVPVQNASFTQLMIESMNDLREPLQAINQSYIQRIEAKGFPNDRRESYRKIFSLLVKHEKELPAFVARSYDRHTEDVKEVQKALENDSYYQALTKEVEDRANALAAEDPDAENQSSDPTSSDRAPSSASIFATSDSKAGNVTGYGYPRNVWSLTFDDGPHGTYTQQILHNLKAHGMKATFFELAQQVKSLPNFMQLARDNGMDLACHSYSHQDLSKESANLTHEIDEAIDTNDRLMGHKEKLFRLPYGAGQGNGTRARKRIANRGLIHVFWSVDTVDWGDKNPDSVYARAMKQINAQNGGVILFHDIHPQSVIASNRVMDTLKAKGKHLCTVQGVVDRINGAVDANGKPVTTCPAASD